MVTYERKSPRAWTVAEAKARLSEVLRRAEDEGPQRIGTRKEFVVVPASVWDERNEPGQSLGQWLIAHAPRIGALELPPRDEGEERPDPFEDWTEDDWKALERRHLDRETGEESAPQDATKWSSEAETPGAVGAGAEHGALRRVWRRE